MDENLFQKRPETKLDVPTLWVANPFAILTCPMPPCYPTHHPPSPCATSLLSYAPSHHGTFLCNLATTKVLRTLLSQVYNCIVKLSMLLYYSCRSTLDKVGGRRQAAGSLGGWDIDWWDT